MGMDVFGVVSRWVVKVGAGPPQEFAERGATIIRILSALE